MKGGTKEGMRAAGQVPGTQDGDNDRTCFCSGSSSLRVEIDGVRFLLTFALCCLIEMSTARFQGADKSSYTENEISFI